LKVQIAVVSQPPVAVAQLWIVRHRYHFRFMDDIARRVIQQHISDMHKFKQHTSDYQRPLMAAIQLIIAEEEAKTAEKLEQQTARLVEHTVKLTRFTRGVFWLTVILGVFAFVQIVIMVFEYCSKAR
jgi:hypothetical protein